MFNLIIATSLLGLLIAYLLARYVLNQEMGNPQMQAISDHIREGAMAFLKRQYGTIAALTAVLAVIIFLIYALSGKVSFGWHTAFAFVAGALCSSVAGFVGMYI